MKTAICMIVRDEVRDIAEWIAFHAIAGFDTQIIFDNHSQDGTADIIQAAARVHDIRYHFWENTGPHSQTLAYEAACEAYKLEFNWMAVLDSDEFLVLTEDVPINDFLARYEGWSAIAVNWAMYGSNGHDASPDGLIIENFTRRAAEDYFPARHVKSIIRPHLAVRCPNPHYFEMREDIDGHYCDPHGRYMLWARSPETPGGVLRGVGRVAPDYSVCRINHYLTRSKAHWRAKLKRAYQGDSTVRKMDDFDQFDRNEVEDNIAMRRVEEVRALAGRYEVVPTCIRAPAQ